MGGELRGVFLQKKGRSDLQGMCGIRLAVHWHGRVREYIKLREPDQMGSFIHESNTIQPKTKFQWPVTALAGAGHR